MTRKRRLPKPLENRSATVKDSVSDNPRAGHNHWLWAVGCIFIVAVAAAIRIRATWNDLWFDEVMSLANAQGISSPWQVFTKIHHDNNHYLNTLWMVVCGQQGNWAGYRVPSVLAGIGSVILAGFIGRRRNAANAAIAMLLVASSYVMVLYSSEARGYAAVVFFAFLSFLFLESYLERPRARTAILFSLSSVLGLLAHLSYVMFLAAALVWSAFRLIRRSAGLKRFAIAMLSCYATPAVLLAVLYFVDIRSMSHSPGLPITLIEWWGQSLAWALGPPSSSAAMVWTTALAALVVSVAGIWLLVREKSDAAVFFACAILAAPIAVVVLRRSDVLFPRFMILGMAFFLILYSDVLTSLFHRGRLGKLLCLVLLAAFLACNGGHVTSLYRYGRGRYGDTVRLLVEHTKGRRIAVAGDPDWCILPLLQFYVGQAETNGKEFAYHKWYDAPQGRPEWFILSEPTDAPKRQLDDSAGNRYQLIASFPHAPLSGFHWCVYHNETAFGKLRLDEQPAD